ncbi:KinB-signaling pathway activation protein [Desmospora activa]|uniref:KinB signaling pathway activation protein n=1 Tax=Desmospora activa DSM 45169 TaxID=1121389 RepID=A0A2T4Z1I6_9BACL|nr:KinB-signaling pathway activation protein [Desmospora activa]PTM54645.1 KinB signaling pathway activation protein [Desmospora activa DSM 45169]
MTIRKLFFLFWTTLALGTLTAPLAGGLLQLFFGPLGIDFVYLLWAGLMFGAIAQMGFFAYMVFNMVARGFIRNPYLYQGLQLLFTVLVLVNIFSTPFRLQGEETTSFTLHLVLPLTILIVSLIVAWFKMKATNEMGFIPALFFMVAATWLEAVPSIEAQSLEMMLLMVLTLMACNTWQIMQLHRLLEPAKTSTNKTADRGETNKHKGKKKKKKKG